MEQLNVPEEKKVPLDFESETIPESVRIFRPLLFFDEERYCCALGPDPLTGVFGYGETVEEALRDWDKNLLDRRHFHKDDDELARYISDTMQATVKKIN